MKDIAKQIRILLEIELKSLRMYFIQIFFNIIIIPISFLIINLLNGNTDYAYMISGFMISSLIGALLNTYAMRVSNIMSIEVLEMYATWNVKNLVLIYGIGFYYLVAILPVLLASMVILLSNGINISIFEFIISLLLGTMIIMNLGILLGSSIKNFYVASGIIAYVNFLLMLITPLYYKSSFTNLIYRIINFVNPISHALGLLRHSVGIEWNMSIISFVYLVAINIVISIINYKRINNLYMTEKYI